MRDHCYYRQEMHKFLCPNTKPGKACKKKEVQAATTDSIRISITLQHSRGGVLPVNLARTESQEVKAKSRVHAELYPS